eukprot:CAMPEP_0198425152 /NCGR_PEP_ID=MMETSP1452-20131203/4360_1 /TAXON_ID=1181717 /ORGANISM="Synchroma pusillum, Strain CCMP3072" /LENGTH=399 /DNA_ID=CAMNT_0044145505 /DNA_START=57 /DNA_END=1254 /DNA_ORIENTATION=+
MYSSLVTNLPKQIMAFSPSVPFHEALPSFLGHADVQAYLEAYSSRVADVLRLSTPVQRVARSPAVAEDHTSGAAVAGGGAWEVDVVDGATGRTETQSFDAVAVCNGHYALPVTPSWPGLDVFRGEVMHSVDYDGSKAWAGKDVLVVGARASGTDIAREATRHARSVTVSDRECGERAERGVLRHVGEVSRATEHGVVLEDGAEVPADVIVFATGYEYDFPFLRDAAGVRVEVESRGVRPLYQHLFHVDHPTLAFVGLLHSVVPFPLFRDQAQWLAAVWSGRARLPPREERAEWQLSQLGALAHPKLALYLGPAQWDYRRHVCGEAGVLDEARVRWIDTSQAVYNDAGAARKGWPGAPDTYRAREYSVDFATGEWSVRAPPDGAGHAAAGGAGDATRAEG